MTEIKHSSHSHTRGAQRGISDEMLHWAIQASEKTYKQGMKFLIVNKHKIDDKTPPQIVDKIKNLVIVMSKSNLILTVYKNNKGAKRIKLKSKRLSLCTKP